MDMVQFLSFSMGFTVLVTVFSLMRSGRLKERYSLLWLAAGAVICALSVSRVVLEYFSTLVGIHYPPSLLFLIGVFFLLAINISFSVRISDLSRKTDLLAQQVAILKGEKDKSTK